VLSTSRSLGHQRPARRPSAPCGDGW
jgi:hypothetical protein